MIQLTGLVKRYGGFTAVDHLDLTIVVEKDHERETAEAVLRSRP